MKNNDLFLFAEPVGRYALDVECVDILKNIKKLKYYQSGHSMIKFSDCGNVLDFFPDLNKQIYNACKNFIHDKMKIPERLEVEIVESWATQTPPKGKGDEHYHSHCFVSGVFYPHSGSQIRFNRENNMSNFWCVDSTEYNEYNSTWYILSPPTGSLILFRNYLTHEIVEYSGSENRYSISFNVMLRGQVGSHTRLTKL